MSKANNLYTEYCTCFYDESTNQVYFYDELKDCTISKQKVTDEAEANKVMKLWADNAPENYICHII